jgi:hypothetical protein
MQRRVWAMIVVRPALCLIAVVSLFVLLSGASATPAGKDVVGTYTNLKFNQEGGDLLGVELRIVRTKKGYQGVLQFAEGRPEELILVDVQVEGKRVKFSIPDDDPNAGSFSGVIENGALTGHFQYKSGGVEDVVLKKGKSYWD